LPVRFAYVRFETVEAAKAAVENMHMDIFEGRRVVVQFAHTALVNDRDRVQKSNPPTKTLFIGNMSFDMTDRDLNALFKDIRNVIDVRVAVDRRTGQPRGFAHAEFIDVASAQAAYEILDGKAPYGRRLRLDYSYSKGPRAVEGGSGGASEGASEGGSREGA
jgi:RNA recognition motif-containing protein